MSIKKLRASLVQLDDFLKIMIAVFIFLVCVVLPATIYDTYKTYAQMHDYAKVQLSQDIPSGTVITINLPSANVKELNMIIEHGYIITSVIHNSNDKTVYITCEKR